MAEFEQDTRDSGDVCSVLPQYRTALLPGISNIKDQLFIVSSIEWAPFISSVYILRSMHSCFTSALPCQDGGSKHSVKRETI